MKLVGIILIGILLIISSFKSSAQTPAAKVYDYITITIVNSSTNKPKSALISINGEKYEEINIKDKAQGEFDNNEVIKLVNKYEREGYELFANNFSVAAGGSNSTLGVASYSNLGYNYFLMRREHKD